MPLDLQHPRRDLRLELAAGSKRARLEAAGSTFYAISAVDGAIASSGADGARATYEIATLTTPVVLHYRIANDSPETRNVVETQSYGFPEYFAGTYARDEPLEPLAVIGPTIGMRFGWGYDAIQVVSADPLIPTPGARLTYGGAVCDGAIIPPGLAEGSISLHWSSPEAFASIPFPVMIDYGAYSNVVLHAPEHIEGTAYRHRVYVYEPAAAAWFSAQTVGKATGVAIPGVWGYPTAIILAPGFGPGGA